MIPMCQNVRLEILKKTAHTISERIICCVVLLRDGEMPKQKF